MLVFLLMAILMPFIYANIRNYLIIDFGAPPPCWKIIRASDRVVWEISRMRGNYPKTTAELFARLEGLGISKETLENTFTCPRGEKKGISFEYYNPAGLKPGRDRFIILYEKPNNHLPSTVRAVVYNDGQVRTLFEHEVYDHLIQQSKSSDDFTWEQSRFNGICPKSWWEREIGIKASHKAAMITGITFILIVVSLSFVFRLTKG